MCDVNGFSFVKTSKKYYDDCAQLLASIIMKNLAPQCYNEQTNLPKNSAEDMNSEQENGNQLELRCVVAIMRHGDRTPKQKMKMVVTHQLLVKSKYIIHLLSARAVVLKNCQIAQGTRVSVAKKQINFLEVFWKVSEKDTIYIW